MDYAAALDYLLGFTDWRKPVVHRTWLMLMTRVSGRSARAKLATIAAVSFSAGVMGTVSIATPARRA